VIRVQPDEGISLQLNGKVPGQMNIADRWIFSTKTTFPKEAGGYERRFTMRSGDQTLFIRNDEAEAAWG
jgi:glucose-6-phosphate 1-dehydrogenase